MSAFLTGMLQTGLAIHAPKIYSAVRSSEKLSVLTIGACVIGIIGMLLYINKLRRENAALQQQIKKTENNDSSSQFKHQKSNSKFL